MHIFTLSLGSWLRRLFVRNPLVRTSDRVEAYATFVALLFAVLSVPVAGAVGTAVYDSRVHTVVAQRLERHAVEATATQDSSATWLPYQSANSTPIQWQFDGRIHTDILSTPNKMTIGDHLSIWVNAVGDRTQPPLTDNDAAAEAVVAALGLCIAVAGAAAAVCALLRSRLNHVRYFAWDRELNDLVDNDGRTNRNA